MSCFTQRTDTPYSRTLWRLRHKAKWLSEEALQIAVKRREAKGKGEKERIPI